jgi:hypothetical protein
LVHVSKPEHRRILAVDIQGFGRLDRTIPRESECVRACTASLGNAMTAAGIDPDQITQTEYGDGVVLLLDPQISKARLLHPLLLRLVSGPAWYSRTAPDAVRLRLRVIAHAGDLLRFLICVGLRPAPLSFVAPHAECELALECLSSVEQAIGDP